MLVKRAELVQGEGLPLAERETLPTPRSTFLVLIKKAPVIGRVKRLAKKGHVAIVDFRVVGS